IEIDAGDIAPMVTWGTSPEHVAGINSVVPDPAEQPDELRRKTLQAALDYMGLQAGRRLDDIAIDMVFIGSCTNSRLEDLRDAAAVLRGRKAVIPGMVVPGSAQVKQAAEAEGLDLIFKDAGLMWLEPGCSLCA